MTRTRPRTAVAVTLTVAAAAALGGLAGTAAALWRASDEVELPDAQGTALAIGIGPVDRSSTDWAAGTTDTVRFTIPGATVARALDDEGITTMFRVTGLAQGATGIDYAVAVPPGAPGTVWAGSVVRVWQTTGAGDDCSAVPDDAPDLSQVTSSIPDDGAEPVDQFFCVHAAWDEARTGTYAGTVTATGTGLDGGVARDSDAWSTGVVPDPAAEPDVVVTLTHTVTRPAP